MNHLTSIVAEQIHIDRRWGTPPHKMATRAKYCNVIDGELLREG